MTLTKLWYSRPRPKLLIAVLSPLSALFAIVVALRKYSYRFGLCKVHRFNVPVIVVGNITMGGTGKTPFVITLVNFLKEQGYRPGVVSRGYGGKAPHYPFAVNAQTDPIHAGEEIVMIAKRTQVPCVVAPKRVQACRQLIDQHDCNVIVSDDGLQHYAMGRAIEILIIDAVRQFGNGFLLPAGPLREPISRLGDVDVVVANGSPNMTLQPQSFVNVKTNQVVSVAHFKNKRVQAIAAIGNPDRFFNTLQRLGLATLNHSFPDHYFFKPTDLNADDCVVMTEKDAIKCTSFATENHWYLPVTAQIAKPVLDKIQTLLVACSA